MEAVGHAETMPGMLQVVLPKRLHLLTEMSGSYRSSTLRPSRLRVTPFIKALFKSSQTGFGGYSAPVNLEEKEEPASLWLQR